MIWHLSFLSKDSALKAPAAPSQTPLEMIAGVCSWLVIIPWGAAPLFLQKDFSLIQTAVQSGNGRFRLLHLCLGGFNSHLHFLGVGSQARKCNIGRANS